MQQACLEVGSQQVTIHDEKGEKKVSRLEALWRRFYHEGAKGNLKAAEFFLQQNAQDCERDAEQKARQAAEAERWQSLVSERDALNAAIEAEGWIGSLSEERVEVVGIWSAEVMLINRELPKELRRVSRLRAVPEPDLASSDQAATGGTEAEGEHEIPADGDDHSPRAEQLKSAETEATRLEGDVEAAGRLKGSRPHEPSEVVSLIAEAANSDAQLPADQQKLTIEAEPVDRSLSTKLRMRDALLKEFEQLIHSPVLTELEWKRICDQRVQLAKLSERSSPWLKQRVMASIAPPQAKASRTSCRVKFLETVPFEPHDGR